MWLAFNAPHGPLQAPPADLAWAGFDPSRPRFALHESKREGADYGAQGRGNTHRQTAIAAIHALDRNIGTVLDALRERSEERRVGKEWVSTCRSRCSPYHYKNKKIYTR